MHIHTIVIINKESYDYRRRLRFEIWRRHARFTRIAMLMLELVAGEIFVRHEEPGEHKVNAIIDNLKSFSLVNLCNLYD